MAPKFGLRMNWKKQQQRSNLSDTDPSNIGTSLNASLQRHLKYLQLGVVGCGWGML